MGMAYNCESKFFWLVDVYRTNEFLVFALVDSVTG